MLATVFVIGPAALAWQRGYMAWPPPHPSVIAVGDHLQMTYFLWLWTHTLTTLSHLPWYDPFQFAATGASAHQPFGWPLALVFVPVDLLYGPVAAYNTLLLLSFPASAGAAWLFARELGVSRAGAAVAGFGFAFAPFRIVRSATHVTALLSPLVPLAFLFAARALTREGRRGRHAAWAFALVYVSLVGSGDLQLALSTTVLLAIYLLPALPSVTLARLRSLRAPGLVALGASAIVAGLMYVVVLEPSIAADGRGIADRLKFTPRVDDLFRRQVSWPHFERYAYPGAWITMLATLGVLAGLRGPSAGQPSVYPSRLSSPTASLLRPLPRGTRRFCSSTRSSRCFGIRERQAGYSWSRPCSSRRSPPSPSTGSEGDERASSRPFRS